MGKSSPLTNLHITSLIIPPTLITFSPLSTLAQIIFWSSTWVLGYSRTHPYRGHIMEHHLSYTFIFNHKFVSCLLMEQISDIILLSQRPLPTLKFHQLKKYYLRNSLKTPLHHLSWIPPPPPLQGKISVWETVHQAITQIPFFYPPPKKSKHSR
jgi:hypothetical protein